MNEGKATPLAGECMAKRNACGEATNICRDARQMLGGMGVRRISRDAAHTMNLESVITYEEAHMIFICW